MSLHVELSDEAKQKFESQQRISTVSSILISILALVLIALILMVLKLATIEQAPEKVVTYSAGLEESDQVVERKVPTNVERKPSEPSALSVRAIAANAVSPVAIPVPEVDIPDPSENFGLGDDFGEGFGDGDGDGAGSQGFAGIPPVMQKRCTPEARLDRLAKNGGTPECEEAVVMGLRWLKEEQAEDGSWSSGYYQAGVTGLVLLAYLGHCETPLSEEFGDTVTRAMAFLIDNAKKNGGFIAADTGNKHWIYEHGIGVYALAESYTFCRLLSIDFPALKQTVEKGGQIIIERQHNASGGWDYNYDQSGNRGGDLSIVGWHVQALKACSHAGINFPGMRRTLKHAADYVKARANNEGGFGYVGKSGIGGFGYDALTGVGLLSLQFLGAESGREVRKGLDYILENSKFEWDGPWSDLYAHYYEGQAMMNRGGRYWEQYNELFRDQVLDNQNEDGSWGETGGGGKVNAAGSASFNKNSVYRTALSVLMLEVYYRFLPGTGEGL